MKNLDGLLRSNLFLIYKLGDNYCLLLKKIDHVISVVNSTKSIVTPVTRLYNIRYPIIQGGMLWVSGWKLAVAVSLAGGLGLIGAGSMSERVLRHHISRAKAVWDGPLGVNVPLMRKDAAKLVKIIVETGIKIVFTSAGNPATFTRYLHENGIIVTHVVPSLQLALKAQDRGVDAIVGEGFEAGGHNGYEEIATLPLITRLADKIDLPLIAAGGIREGRGILAALALGADGAQLGTRFACSAESSASETYKNSIVRAREPATILTLKKLSPTRMLQGSFADRCRKAEYDGMEIDELENLLGEKRAKKGTFEGDLSDGYMEAGEVAGDIYDISSVEEIMTELINGIEQSVQRVDLLIIEKV